MVLNTEQEEYKNTSEKLDITCACGDNIFISYNNLKKSKIGCPKCSRELTSSKNRHSHNDVVKIFKDNDCTLLTDSYQHSKQKLKFTCACGNEGVKRLDAFIASPYCVDCSIGTWGSKNGYRFDKVLEFFKSKKLILITKKNEYRNKKSEVKFICSCGDVCVKRFCYLYEGYCLCEKCVYHEIAKNNKLSYTETYDFIVNNKCKLITKEEYFINANSYIEIECGCGEIFTTTFINFKHENKRQCNKCGIATRSKEFAPRWKGGITPENSQIRHSAEYINWRNSVYKRDNYTCQCCGDNKGGNLQAHHILGFAEYPDLRFDINNAITLCNSCHNFNQYGSFHHTYGTTGNTPEQLQEYILRYNNGEFNDLRLSNKL